VNQQVVGFGMHSDLKEEQANCMRARIALYQVVFPSATRWQERLWGPYDVKVHIDDTEFRRSRPRMIVKWRTQQNAYITYDRVDRRTAVAWMPDDPFWHNRLFLMDSPALLNQVTHRRSHSGIQSLDEVQMEIKCLEEVLHETVPIWTAVEGKRVLGDFKSAKEAKSWIEDLTEPTLKLINNVMTPVKVRKRKIDIIERSTRQYPEKVLKIIEKEKNLHEFGWTQCPFFTEKVQPKVKAMIKERREKMEKKPGVTAAPIDMIRSIAKMSEEEKAALRSMLMETPGNSKSSDIPEVVPEEVGDTASEGSVIE